MKNYHVAIKWRRMSSIDFSLSGTVAVILVGNVKSLQFCSFSWACRQLAHTTAAVTEVSRAPEQLLANHGVFDRQQGWRIQRGFSAAACKARSGFRCNTDYALNVFLLLIYYLNMNNWMFHAINMVTHVGPTILCGGLKILHAEPLWLQSIQV